MPSVSMRFLRVSAASSRMVGEENHFGSHGSIGALPASQFGTDGTFKIRKRRLVLDDEAVENRIRVPEYYEELYDLADGETFILLDAKKRARKKNGIIGVGFKYSDKERTSGQNR